MTENKDNPVSGPVAADRDVQDMMRLLGQALNSATFYGIGHKMTAQSLSTVLIGVNRLLTKREALSFALNGDELLVEGQAVDRRNALVSGVANRMEALNVDHFEIRKGVVPEELAVLVEVLGMNPEKLKAAGGFAMVLAARKVEHIVATASSFQKISDSDLVLKRDNLLQGLVDAVGGEKPQAVEQIVAFLKGDTGGQEGKSGSGAGEPSPAEDAAKLADLILKSAEVAQQQASVEGGESLMDLVVGCLRREAKKVMNPAVMKTAKGRKNAGKTLMLLEQNVLERLRAMGGGCPEEVIEAVAEECAELQDDLAADSLVEEYAKKRKAAEQVERKIKRYMKRHEDDGAAAELQEKLAGEDVSPSSWKKLQVTPEPKSEKEGLGKGGGGGGVGEGVQMLAVLLAELDTLLAEKKEEARDERRKKIEDAVTKIDQQAAAVVADTEKRLDEFADVVGAVAMAAETADQQRQQEMSRRKLLELLAEITQELFQPLSVIHSSNSLMLILDNLSEEQSSMLKLSICSCERMKSLTERLRDICGNPESLRPDTKVLDSIYKETIGTT